VGETNDGELNDIRARAITPQDILKAIEGAKSGPIEEGAVGAGTGTVAFGWKGGIGTSSRRLPASLGGYTVGVLVQSNYGGILSIDGARIGERLGQYYLKEQVDGSSANGSIMVVVATDAPLSDRNLTRLAKRAMVGVARTGSSFTNGSGDYVISFSTAESVRRTPSRTAVVSSYPEISNDHVSPLFQAVAEATEEAVYNSLFMANTVTSYNVVSRKEVTVKQFPIAEIMKKPQGCP
jgi:D-aminopeptidase